MSAYDKLAVCLFNFKCKALQGEEEGKRKEHDGELGERERGSEMPACFWHSAGRMPQMLDVCVWGTDKATHKFENGMSGLSTSLDLEGGEGGSWQKDRC